MRYIPIRSPGRMPIEISIEKPICRGGDRGSNRESYRGGDSEAYRGGDSGPINTI